MKHLCLRSAAALTVAVSMAGFVAPVDAQDAVNAYGERITWWHAPVPVRDARYDGLWYYDAASGYYYSRPFPGAIPYYYSATRGYYEAPRAYPSAATGVVDRIEIIRGARADEAFRVTVLLDNGAFHTVMLDRVVDLRTGDRVRLEGNALFRG